MFTIFRPSAAAVATFIEAQRSVPLSYSREGMTRGSAPKGFREAHIRRLVGKGENDFLRACEAIRQWEPHQQSWAWALAPEGPPAPGALVAIAAQAGIGWWTNACRIVYIVDESGPLRRFGFAYGTLAGHIEQGEARFTVALEEGGGVWYEVLTHSRPHHWMARTAAPLSRWYQDRFARGAASAMARAIERSK